MKRAGITTVGEVLDLLEKGEEAIMSIRNFGEKSLDELRDKMKEKGYLEEEEEEEEGSEEQPFLVHVLKGIVAILCCSSFKT